MIDIAVKLRLPLACVGVLVLACVLYWPGLNGPFVLDDWQNIVKVHLEEMDWDAFVYSVTHNTSGMLGRSVSIVSFVLSGLQFGLSAWGYKFHNLLLHLLNAVLLLRVLQHALQLLVPAVDAQRRTLCAGLTAALWLLHPLQVSTVLYVVQRMSILAALFMLLGLLTYFAIRRETAWSYRYWLLAFLLYPLLQGLAVFSKETGVLLPLFVLACEALAWRKTGSSFTMARPLQLFLLVFALLPLAGGGLYLLSHFDQIIDYSTRTFTLGERLLTQLHVVPFYMKLILLPRLSDMSLFHDDVVATVALDPVTALLLLFMLALAGLVGLLRKRAPVVAFGIVWFLVAHLLESTVIPLELVFEHRNYLALAGLLLPVMFYATTYGNPRVSGALLTVFVLVLLLQTFARVQEWSHEELMFTQAVADHPQSSRARTTLANVLTTNGQYDEAYSQLQAAADIDKQDAGPVLHAVFIRCLLMESAPELLIEAARRLAAYPASVYALNAMDNMLSVINSGQCTHVSPEDMGRLLVAANQQASVLENPTMQGYLLRLQGVAAMLDGEYPQGVVFFRMAHEAGGDNGNLAELIEAQINFGELGDAAETLAVLQQINEQRFGSESYQVERLTALLSAARNDAAVPEAPVAELPQPAP